MHAFLFKMTDQEKYKLKENVTNQNGMFIRQPDDKLSKLRFNDVMDVVDHCENLICLYKYFVFANLNALKSFLNLSFS